MGGVTLFRWGAIRAAVFLYYKMADFFAPRHCGAEPGYGWVKLPKSSKHYSLRIIDAHSAGCTDPEISGVVVGKCGNRIARKFG